MRWSLILKEKPFILRLLIFIPILELRSQKETTAAPTAAILNMTQIAKATTGMTIFVQKLRLLKALSIVILKLKNCGS